MAIDFVTVISEKKAREWKEAEWRRNRTAIILMLIATAIFLIF